LNKEVFFFEKKNQKTFASAAGIGSPSGRDASRNGQKFFGSFFQKRTLPYSLPCLIASAHGFRPG
jgi:hypothetical protein